MRRTVRLDPDVAAQLRAVMQARGVSFQDALHQSLREGLKNQTAQQKPFRQKTHSLGAPSFRVEKALAYASELEDRKILRKLAIGT